ncbi:unnamed protein product [Ixodes persulcatus]
MAPTVECAKCHKEIQADGKNLVCADCTSAYHLGKNCSGVGDSTFTTMGQAKREKWVCRSCRSRDNPPALNPSPCSPSTDTDSLKAQLSSMNKKLEALLSLKESVDALQTIPTRLNELLLLKPIVEGLTTTVSDVQASIADFSGKYDILLKAATSNTQAVKTLQDEVSSLQATVQSQAAEILQVRAAQNDSEQYSRLPNLELHGLAVSPGENLISCISELASKLSLADSFQPSDILEIHRLPAKRDGIPPVLVRFYSVRAKETWMAERGTLRSLCQTEGLPRLYFNENLTRSNKELFWQARQKARAKGYKFIWVKRGKIFAKKSEGADLIRITRLTDIDKIV